MKNRKDPSIERALHRLRVLSGRWLAASSKSNPGLRRLWRRVRKVNSVLHRMGRSLDLSPHTLCTLLAEGYAWRNPLVDLHLLTDPHLRAGTARTRNSDPEMDLRRDGVREVFLRKLLAEIHHFHNVPSAWHSFLRSPVGWIPPPIRPELLGEHAQLARLLHEELWYLSVRLANHREGPQPWEHLNPYKKSGAIVTLCGQGAVVA